MTPLRYGAATDVGLIRKNNEDCFLACPELGLWLVADGMGGHDAGEVASRIARDYVKGAVTRGSNLRSAIASSHQAVITASDQNVGSPGMGTTVVALRTHGLEYEIGWVGDSRAYLWTGDELHQLSQDHSYVQALVDAGTLSEEDAQDHPQKNVILQSIGVTSLAEVSVDEVFGLWEPGHRILLCSDGLTDLVPDEEIAEILSQEGDEQTLVRRLIQRALDYGGVDNVTVQIISAPDSDGALGRLQKWILRSPLAPLIRRIRDKQRVYAVGGILASLTLLLLLLR